MYGVLAIILTALPSLALATDYVVGDGKGWTIQFDYKSWASDKDFRVGDRLGAVNYPANSIDKHNVIKVNGTSFQGCEFPPESDILNTGKDIITLKTSGNKWYICGIPNHCVGGGQKLVINVKEALVGPAAPPMPNSANGILASGYKAFAAAVAVIALMVMV